MQTYYRRSRAVEIESLDRFLNIRPQLVPGVTLSENAFGKALGAKTPVSVLRDLEHDFVHSLEFRRLRDFEQGVRFGAAEAHSDSSGNCRSAKSPHADSSAASSSESPS